MRSKSIKIISGLQILDLRLNSSYIPYMASRSKILYWTPRVIYIATVAFISLFALDAFDSTFNTWHQIRNFIMHMIPSFALIAFLIYVWRKELTGGSILIFLGLALSVLVFRHNFRMNHSVFKSLLPVFLLTLPFFITGILFIIDYFHRRKRRNILH
ncbi:hypothetical protein J1N10_08110 [Carboxylicivirga sp. A043]|uniref:DUF7670 domain-containing protein n=1 Tax=Carboxylicivirga litoralis TaxID=2816963 RepID=UPI0021CAFE5E|nr:hypothetical protein [Carboxylicivirga sp. A043]MCU4155937.1 hypothetical protein [Carboxylicivirga sp. A043]